VKNNLPKYCKRNLKTEKAYLLLIVHCRQVYVRLSFKFVTYLCSDCASRSMASLESRQQSRRARLWRPHSHSTQSTRDQASNAQSTRDQVSNGQPVHGQTSNAWPTHGQDYNAYLIRGNPTKEQSTRGEPCNAQSIRCQPSNASTTHGQPSNAPPLPPLPPSPLIDPAVLVYSKDNVRVTRDDQKARRARVYSNTAGVCFYATITVLIMF
jgi:hypothetical protein